MKRKQTPLQMTDTRPRQSIYMDLPPTGEHSMCTKTGRIDTFEQTEKGINVVIDFEDGTYLILDGTRVTDDPTP